MAGEECSSTADCYNDAACLGGRCCSMSQSQYADVETARYSECTACADSTHDKPGTCVACGTGYHVVTGEETDADIDSLYYLGICTIHYPCSDASQYYTTQYDTCYAKTTPGGACSSPQSYRCSSGLCSNDICCDQAAAQVNDGQCCTLCSSSDGSCLKRGACPSCDASGDIPNGVSAPCTNSLAEGTSCEPTCNEGYILSGSRSCDGGTLTNTATCTAVDCAANQYWDGESCEACPGKSTSAGGAVTSCTCTSNQYIISGACTACPAQSTSDDAGSTYCICDGGYYAKKTAGVWSCETCEGATASRIPQDDGEDAKCLSALKATAEASRDTLLGDIADESVKKKAKLLADAAIAGEKVRKITVKEEASDEASACSSAFTKADMQPSDGACVATAASSGRRRLSASTYDVELVFSSSTVSESKLSAAVNSLKANGVEVVKSESAVDPIAELETIPGVDSAKLTTFKTDATAAVEAAAAPAGSSSSTPPTSPPPPPPIPPPPIDLVLDDDDFGTMLDGKMAMATASVCAVLLLALVM